MKTALIGMILGPTAVGFMAGYSGRSILVLILLTFAGTMMFAVMFSLFPVSGDAEDQAGAPRE